MPEIQVGLKIISLFFVKDKPVCACSSDLAQGHTGKGDGILTLQGTQFC